MRVVLSPIGWEKLHAHTKILKIAIHLAVQLKRVVALGPTSSHRSSKGRINWGPLFIFFRIFSFFCLKSPLFYSYFFSWRRLFTWRYFFRAWLNFASSADVVAPIPGYLPRTALKQASTLPTRTAQKHVERVQNKQL